MVGGSGGENETDRLSPPGSLTTFLIPTLPATPRHQPAILARVDAMKEGPGDGEAETPNVALCWIDCSYHRHSSRPPKKGFVPQRGRKQFRGRKPAAFRVRT